MSVLGKGPDHVEVPGEASSAGLGRWTCGSGPLTSPCGRPQVPLQTREEPLSSELLEAPGPPWPLPIPLTQTGPVNLLSFCPLSRHFSLPSAQHLGPVLSPS